MCDVEIDLVGDLWAFGCLDRLTHEQKGARQDQAHSYHKLLEVRHGEKVLHLL